MKQPQKLWERWEGEGDKPYEAFQLYMTEGNDRSIPKVAQKLSKSVPLLKRWSAKFKWVDRVRAWDEQKDSLTTEKMLDRLQKEADTKAEENIAMLKRHASQAQAYGSVLTAIEANFLKRIQEDKEALNNLTLPELLNYIIRGGSVLPKVQEAEAVARGLRRIIGEQFNTENIGDMTTERLDGTLRNNT